jgi:hypothetical protein
MQFKYDMYYKQFYKVIIINENMAPRITIKSKIILYQIYTEFEFMKNKYII